MLPVVSPSHRMIPAARSALRTLFLSSALIGVGVQGVAAQTVDDTGGMSSQQLNTQGCHHFWQERSQYSQGDGYR